MRLVSQAGMQIGHSKVAKFQACAKHMGSVDLICRKQGQGDPGAAQGWAACPGCWCQHASEVCKAKPRARLAITAKSKPPTGDSHDFTMVFTDVQGADLRLYAFFLKLRLGNSC